MEDAEIRLLAAILKELKELRAELRPRTTSVPPGMIDVTNLMDDKPQFVASPSALAVIRATRRNG